MKITALSLALCVAMVGVAEAMARDYFPVVHEQSRDCVGCGRVVDFARPLPWPKQFRPGQREH